MKDRFHILLVSILIFISAVLFYPLFHELYIFYSNDTEDSSYVFIIPVFTAYFIWVQRDKLKNFKLERYEVSFPKSGIILMAYGLLLFIIGRYTYILFIQAVAFVVFISSSLFFLYGKDLLKLTFVPILFLLFMMPIPTPAYYSIAEPLKFFIARASTFFLSLLNIPVFLEGNTIHLPSISLLVHETCSGLRTIIALLIISSAFTYLFLKSYIYKFVFIALSVPLGILVNVLRVFIVGVLSVLYDSNVAMKFHEHAWGVVTPVGIAATFLIGNIFRCLERKGM